MVGLPRLQVLWLLDILETVYHKVSYEPWSGLIFFFPIAPTRPPS
jgi:hypothetical protein